MDLPTTDFLRVLHRTRSAGCLAGLVLSLTVGIAAHELEATVSFAAPAVIIRAAYGGSEPVPFAKIQVFAPSSTSQEFQTSVTDRRGYFSFVPDGPGVWRVIIDDEEGHRRDVSLTVPEPFNTNSGPLTPSVSRLERALLGVALIIGVTGFVYGVKSRRISSRPSS